MEGLYGKLGEYESLDELNYLASKLDEMSESEYAQFQAGMEMAPSRIRAMFVIRATVSVSITTASAAVQPALQGMYPSLQAELPGGGVGVPTLPVPAREKRRG